MPAAKYTISHCTVADSDELTRNNIPAFWADPNFRLAWSHRTLDHHISEMAKRTPHNLTKDRSTRRHEKATDPASNGILGYARWILPPSHSTDDDGSPAWAAAVVPAPGGDREAEFERLAAAAVFDPNKAADAISLPICAARDEILARRPYLRLDYLAVHPDHQGKGVGTALVQSGIEQAAAMGLDIFVYAFAAGVRLYERLGFRIECDFLQDDTVYGGQGNHYTALMVYEH